MMPYTVFVVLLKQLCMDADIILHSA